MVSSSGEYDGLLVLRNDRPNQIHQRRELRHNQLINQSINGGIRCCGNKQKVCYHLLLLPSTTSLSILVYVLYIHCCYKYHTASANHHHHHYHYNNYYHYYCYYYHHYHHYNYYFHYCFYLTTTTTTTTTTNYYHYYHFLLLLPPLPPLVLLLLLLPCVCSVGLINLIKVRSRVRLSLFYDFCLRF